MAKKAPEAANRAKSTLVSKQPGSGQTDNKSDTHGIEWILGASAGLVILLIVGFLGFEAVTGIGGKPVLSLQIVEQRDTEAGTEVNIEVRNDGRATAASVEIAGSTDGLTWRQVTLDYAPAQSSREVTLILPPGYGSAEIEVVGYVVP